MTTVNNSFNQATTALVVGPIGIAVADPNTTLILAQKNQAASTASSTKNTNSGGLSISSVEADGSLGGYIAQYGSAFSDSTVDAGNTALLSNVNATGLTIATVSGNAIKLKIGTTLNASWTSTGGQYRGKNTNTAPPAGFIGEELVASVALGSAVVLSSGVTANVTSVTLTPGVWDITGQAKFTDNGSSWVGNQLVAGILSATSASAVDIGEAGSTYFAGTSLVIAGIGAPYLNMGPSRVTISSNTTYYLNIYGSASVTFSGKGYGLIKGVRVG